MHGLKHVHLMRGYDIVQSHANSTKVMNTKRYIGSKIADTCEHANNS